MNLCRHEYFRRPVLTKTTRRGRGNRVRLARHLMDKPKISRSKYVDAAAKLSK